MVYCIIFIYEKYYRHITYRDDNDEYTYATFSRGCNKFKQCCVNDETAAKRSNATLITF